MTFQEMLNKVHIRFEKNTDYPDTSSEDFIVRREYGDDMITMWEKEVMEGVYWDELKEDASFVAGGTGTDSLTTSVPDFLSFMRSPNMPAVIKSGNSEWTEVTPSEGNIMEQIKSNNYVFWVEGSNLRTLPAISGTVTFPYLRTATRYPLGTEVTPIEIPNEYFLIEGILAYLYLDDGNMNGYQAHMNNAVEMLKTMKYKALANVPSPSTWGFGM